MHVLPETAGEGELLALLEKLNTDLRLHGILVQVPLPKQIREAVIYSAVLPQKDIWFSSGQCRQTDARRSSRLSTLHAGGHPRIARRSEVKTDGAEVVIFGRGNIVGKPMAALLCQKAKGANATVTICHSGTRDIRRTAAARTF